MIVHSCGIGSRQAPAALLVRTATAQICQSVLLSGMGSRRSKYNMTTPRPRRPRRSAAGLGTDQELARHIRRRARSQGCWPRGSRCHAFQQLHVEKSRRHSRSKVYKGGRRLNTASLSNSHHRLIASAMQSPVQQQQEEYSINKTHSHRRRSRAPVSNTSLSHQSLPPLLSSS